MDTPGDYAWILSSTALVFMMIPGIALFYSGLRSQSTSLSLIWLNMMAVSIVSIQWYLFGYSLVFTPGSGSHFIGNLDNAVFRNTTDQNAFARVDAPDTPAMVFGLFQGMFAAFTMALVTGVVAERGRLLSFLIFALFWTTFVYDPIAYWMWNANGWSNRMGSLDWAGGTPVHISSGAASLAYTLILKRMRENSNEPYNDSRLSHNPHQQNGSRRTPPPHMNRIRGRGVTSESKLRSHNIPSALLGMMLVWFGWFGFNAGSELRANSRAASTFIATNLAACSGGVVYTMLEQMSRDRWTGIGFCNGAFVGMVAITPGAGFVPAWAALVYGPTSALLCFLFLKWKRLSDFLDREEPLDISLIHGFGGLWGMFLTGIFADKNVALLDGSIIKGGAINGHGKQIGIQLAGGVAGLAYSFIVTLLILVFLELLSYLCLPGLSLRPEPRGTGPMKLDELELGDRAAYQILCSCQACQSIAEQPRPEQSRRTPPPLLQQDRTPGTYSMAPLPTRTSDDPGLAPAPALEAR